MKLNYMFLLACLSFFSFSCSSQKKQEPVNKKLTIFHAGSLSVPFKEISRQFKEENPGVEIFLEAAGSRTCARKISDLKKPCDIMASADYTVINTLLIPDHASWNIKFASNEMCIVYHKESRKADKITKENWYEILQDKDIAFGRSNPNADPCGYRAVLTMKLAEKFFNKNGLSDILLKKDIKYIRPKETDLLALLESNSIDYLFLYRSVAKQHKLEYILLDDEVNLKIPELTDLYKTVTVDISGKTPGSIVTKKGAPMVYGITIPKNAPNSKLAIKFMTYILEKTKGMAVMEKMGQPSMVPSHSDTYDLIPPLLQKFAEKS